MRKIQPTIDDGRATVFVCRTELYWKSTNKRRRRAGYKITGRRQLRERLIVTQLQYPAAVNSRSATGTCQSAIERRCSIKANMAQAPVIDVSLLLQ